MSQLAGVALVVVGLVGLGMVRLGMWHRRQVAAAKKSAKKRPGRHRDAKGQRRRRGECSPAVPRQRVESEPPPRSPDAYDWFTENKDKKP